MGAPDVKPVAIDVDDEAGVFGAGAVAVGGDFVLRSVSRGVVLSVRRGYRAPLRGPGADRPRLGCYLLRNDPASTGVTT